MENQAKPAPLNKGLSGRMEVVLSPSTQYPPWTMMAVGKGPLPAGIEPSSSNGTPLGRAYSTLLIDCAPFGPVAKAADRGPATAAGIHAMAKITAPAMSLGSIPTPSKVRLSIAMRVLL